MLKNFLLVTINQKILPNYEQTFHSGSRYIVVIYLSEGMYLGLNNLSSLNVIASK